MYLAPCAAATNGSLPLVLAAQLVRLIIVMIAGPSMAKAVAGWQRPTTWFAAFARGANTAR
jgi:hypothetical protein